MSHPGFDVLKRRPAAAPLSLFQQCATGGVRRACGDWVRVAA
jgi:hypothetical protein